MFPTLFWPFSPCPQGETGMSIDRANGGWLWSIARCSSEWTPWSCESFDKGGFVRVCCVVQCASTKVCQEMNWSVGMYVFTSCLHVTWMLGLTLSGSRFVWAGSCSWRWRAWVYENNTEFWHASCRTPNFFEKISMLPGLPGATKAFCSRKDAWGRESTSHRRGTCIKSSPSCPGARVKSQFF